MTTESYTKKMYDRFGAEYQRGRDEKIQDRAYNEFLEVPCMLDAVGKIKGRKLLDVGCGAGIHIKHYLKKGAKCLGMDLSKTMIELAKKNCPDVDFKTGSVVKLPYQNSSFDIVTASLVIDYVKDLNKAFSEVRRVLKKGGLFFYSDNSPIQMAREIREDKRFIYNIVGHIKDKKTNKKVGFGTNWKEGIIEFEMVPGMKVKWYKRMFRTHLEAIVKSGFELVDFIDCKPVPEFRKYNPEAYGIFTKYPLFSIFVCRKK